MLTRIEAVDFDWGTGAPGTGVHSRQLLGALERQRSRRRRPAPTASRRCPTTACACGSTACRSSTTGPTTRRRPTPARGINLVAGQRVDDHAWSTTSAAGDATMRLRWRRRAAPPRSAIPASQLLPQRRGHGHGLTGSYFNNTTLSGAAVLTRIEAVDFDWGNGSPGAGRERRQLLGALDAAAGQAPAAGNYRFQTVSRTTACGCGSTACARQQLDRPRRHDQHHLAVSFGAGQRVRVRIEYYDNTGGRPCGCAGSRQAPATTCRCRRPACSRTEVRRRPGGGRCAHQRRGDGLVRKSKVACPGLRRVQDAQVRGAGEGVEGALADQVERSAPFSAALCEKSNGVAEDVLAGTGVKKPSCREK